LIEGDDDSATVDDDDNYNVQGGYRLELLVYDADGNVNMTYSLTSPAGAYVGADNSTFVLPHLISLSTAV